MSDEPRAEALARVYTLLSAGFQHIAHAADVLDRIGETEVREEIRAIEAPSYAEQHGAPESRPTAGSDGEPAPTTTPPTIISLISDTSIRRRRSASHSHREGHQRGQAAIPVLLPREPCDPSAYGHPCPGLPR
jgi:hypothetical protein